MHLISKNSIFALRLRGFAAVSAVVVLSAVSDPSMAVASNHTLGFLTASTESKLWMVDKNTHQVLAEIPKDGPRQSVVTSDGKTRYSVNTKENLVLVVKKSENGNDEQQSVCVPKGPYGLALSLDGKQLFVFSMNANTISAICTQANKVIEVYTAPAYHFGVKVTEDGHLTMVR